MAHNVCPCVSRQEEGGGKSLGYGIILYNPVKNMLITAIIEQLQLLTQAWKGDRDWTVSPQELR